MIVTQFSNNESNQISQAAINIVLYFYKYAMNRADIISEAFSLGNQT